MLFDDPFKPKKRKRTLTPADRKRVAAHQGWKCKGCGDTLPAHYHVDHIKRFSQGGSDRSSNLQALCPNCHAEKTESERHRAKQAGIRKKETGLSDPLAGLFGARSPPRRKTDIFGGSSIFGSSPKKRGKRPRNPFGF